MEAADTTIDQDACRAHLTFGLDLARKSGQFVRAAMARGFTTALKADASCVTEVDTAVEELLRAAILARFPGHGIVGEEFPPHRPEADFQWILDPIDGTENFARGTPTFGTIIGLHHRGVPVMGIVDHPALGLTYSAARGCGAWCNGRRISVDGYAHVHGQEIIVTTAPENFEKSGEQAVLERIQHAFPNTRTYRDCFAHTRVYQGSADAMVDYNLNLWDLAACQVLVEEAGGRYVCTNERELAGKTYYSVVFGKAGVVERLLAVIAAETAR